MDVLECDEHFPVAVLRQVLHSREHVERFLRGLRVAHRLHPTALDTTYLDDGLYLLAGSGGPSSCINPSGTFPNVTCSGNYSKPSWQSGAGVPNDSARDIPDVSLFAGNGLHYSFYVVCQMDANASNGGNSSSCDLNAPYTDFQGGCGNLGVGTSVRGHHGAGEPDATAARAMRITSCTRWRQRAGQAAIPARLP